MRTYVSIEILDELSARAQTWSSVECYSCTSSTKFSINYYAAVDTGTSRVILPHDEQVQL